MKLRPIVLALVLSSSPASALADFEAGFAAYEKGDYASALQEWRPLAEQGHAFSQYFLGLIYENGEGVPASDVEAVKWYRLAAAQELARPQGKLGLMYATGEGVPQDDIKAYAWSYISAASGDETAKGNLRVFSRRMTPSQREDALQLSRELWEKYGKQ